MKLAFDWTAIINIIGAVNGLFLTFVILKIKKGNKTTNIILAALTFSLSMVIIASIFYGIKFYLFYPHFMMIFTQFYLTLGPLLFLYTKALTEPAFKMKKKYSLHFIPFALQFAINFPIYIKSSAEKIEIFKYFMGHPESNNQTVIIRSVHIFIYLVLAVFLLRKHSKRIKNSFSSLEKIKLNWLYNLILAFSSVLIIYIIFCILRVYDNLLFYEIGQVFLIWETFVVFFVGYKGLLQMNIFWSPEDADHEKKQTKLAVADKQAEIFQKKLLLFMEKEKPFLESELTLKELSDKTGIPSYYLSHIINKKLNRNFFEFINRYRVEEAKRMFFLPAYQKNNILNIAFEAGFNSKSTFNLVFKKYAKMTPSQFIKKYKKKSPNTSNSNH